MTDFKGDKDMSKETHTIRDEQIRRILRGIETAIDHLEAPTRNESELGDNVYEAIKRLLRLADSVASIPNQPF